MKSALQTMKEELAQITLAQAECITESGFIKNECKYKYQLLTRKARSFQEAIVWMEEQVYNRA